MAGVWAANVGLAEGRAARRALVMMAMMLVASLAAPRLASATTYAWKFDSNGGWNAALNWTVVSGPPGVGYPNLPGDVAIFPEILTAERTITIPSGITIVFGALHIVEDQGLIIQADGTGRLAFQTLTGDAALSVSGTGSHRIAAPVRLDDHLTIFTSVPGSRITFNNGISQGLVTPRNITMTGACRTPAAPRPSPAR